MTTNIRHHNPENSSHFKVQLLYVVYLTTISVRTTAVSNSSVISDIFRGCHGLVWVTILVFAWRNRTNMKNLRQGSQCSGFDSNLTFDQYISEMLQLEQNSYLSFFIKHLIAVIHSSLFPSVLYKRHRM